MNTLSTFSRRLREARTAARLSQQALADAAGLTRLAVLNLERGSMPSLDTALALARALGLPLADLTGEPEKNGGKP